MALVTSLLILMLCAIVVTAVLQLATHTAQRSGLSRDRTAALNAAEAGIQAELSLISNGSCPTTAGPETPLPNQALPSASYIIQAPPAGKCTVNGSAVIVATGYVPNATRPSTTTTLVAHINRSQGAPVSGGASGNYDFPDALYTDGTLSATSGALNLYGTGGSIPSITANGDITIGSSSVTGSQLAGAINGQGKVTAFASQIGGQVVGTKVTLNGPTVQGPVQATGDLSLTNATVNGAATYGGGYSHSGAVTVTGGATAGSPVLPFARPLGQFDNSSPANIGSVLGVGTTVTPGCGASPTTWTAAFYDIPGPCPSPNGYAPSAYSPAASNGVTVVVVQGAFNVTVPPTAVGGQLYVIDVGGGGSDSLTITGTGSTLPVFAFTDGTLNLSGTLAGQLVGHAIAVTGATSLTFTPPAIPMPDIAFPVGYSAPDFSSTAFLSRVSYQYQCPGTTAC